jgi:hypothetical protein
VNTLGSTNSTRTTNPTTTVMQAALAMLSLAAAAIHFAVIGEHFAEYAAFGIFFSVVGWLQALWAVGVMVLPTRRVLLAGLVGNAVVVLVWIVSRTAGLPLGPDPGIAEPAAFVDVLSTILEVATVAGTAVLLARRAPAHALSGRAAWLALLTLVTVLGVLTTSAIAAGVGSGGSHGTTHDDGGQNATSDGVPGYARVDLGNDGDIVQVLVDSSGSVAQVHVTFFTGDGKALDVQTVTMSGISPSGKNIDLPVALFEPGHFAASTELEPGEWAFRLQGVDANDQTFDVSFDLTIEQP